MCRSCRMLGNFCFVRGSASVMPLIETNPPRRGGPPRPPARIDTVLLMLMSIADVHAALAGWMHRVCADLAGCWETSVLCLVRLGSAVTLAGYVGRPYPMVTMGLCGIDWLILTIVDGARPDSRRMPTGSQPPAAGVSGSRHTRSTFHPASR